MDLICIILLIVVAIIVALGVAIGLRQRRSGDYDPRLSPRDEPSHSSEAQTTLALRYGDRLGAGGGGGGGGF